MQDICPNCRPEKPCKKHRLLNDFKKTRIKIKDHFSGPTPPEIFVGRYNYPDVNIGILSATDYDSAHCRLRDYEDWSRNNLSIQNILRLRSQLVYGRKESNIRKENRVTKVLSELALTHKTTSTEFFLSKALKTSDYTLSRFFRPMTNKAQLLNVRLQENPRVHKKVDYLSNDTHAKATDVLDELKDTITIDHMQKLLSAGVLGQKSQRKMVPTRWSITAVDDTISKSLLKEIRYFKTIDNPLVLEGDYLGNYIKVLLLPQRFAFEAIEVWEDERTSKEKCCIVQDFEGFFGRKTYARNVAGGYYAMRLPVCEYLKEIRRQASVLVIREITKEYSVPLGVGIVREATRRAKNNKPRVFETQEDATSFLKSHFLLDHDAIEESWVLNENNKQKSINDFF